ncbi:MAG: hypothetical protein PHW62_00485 [Candidatus Ratteibacteria bacterium]|nr:hypothetical protein [Candidatus Ratteibacteria bacterium]
MSTFDRYLKVIKEYLCREESIYQDGKLVVHGGVVFLYTVFLSVLIIVSGHMIALELNGLVDNPLRFVVSVITFFIIIILAFCAYTILGIFGTFGIIKYLVEKCKITCDKVIFPESVTKIYTEIEALPEDDMKIFVIGLRPLMRKYRTDKKL